MVCDVREGARKENRCWSESFRRRVAFGCFKTGLEKMDLKEL